MNVSDMLELMATLGIGEDTAVESPNDIFLQYLNLAHYELYSETAGLNSKILKNEQLVNVAGESNITIQNEPLIIAKIFPTGGEVGLIGLDPLSFASYRFQNPNPGFPVVYYFKGTEINFYPFENNIVYNFDVWYAPEVTDLEENTEEADIPYPKSYQPILVHGALDYLFESEGGFKSPEKQKKAEKRWNAGKARLKSYFYGSNKQRITTFSNA